jgi:leucyl-tRNA synthetase
MQCSPECAATCHSQGAEINFDVQLGDEGAAGPAGQIQVYTTRPDTLFGATYLVLAPEHPMLQGITSEAQRAEVTAYVEAAARKSDLERTELQKDKSGVFTGGRRSWGELGGSWGGAGGELGGSRVCTVVHVQRCSDWQLQVLVHAQVLAVSTICMHLQHMWVIDGRQCWHVIQPILLTISPRLAPRLGLYANSPLTPTCRCTCAGSYATNPATGEAAPIWVADYVLGSYGSGAIMAVPGHDARDHECAVKFGLPIKQVVAGSGGEELPFCDPGTAVNSSSSGIDLNGLPTAEAKAKVRGHMGCDAGLQVQQVQQPTIVCAASSRP